ncbi:hypothetical protein EJB05_30354, partial [Eragrostis curvula]
MATARSVSLDGRTTATPATTLLRTTVRTFLLLVLLPSAPIPSSSPFFPLAQRLGGYRNFDAWTVKSYMFLLNAWIFIHIIVLLYFGPAEYVDHLKFLDGFQGARD